MSGIAFSCCSLYALFILLHLRHSGVGAQISGGRNTQGTSNANGHPTVIQAVNPYQAPMPAVMYQLPVSAPMVQHLSGVIQQPNPMVQQPAGMSQHATAMIQQPTVMLQQPNGGAMWIPQPQQGFGQPPQLLYASPQLQSAQVVHQSAPPMQTMPQMQQGPQVVYVVPQSALYPQTMGQPPSPSQIVAPQPAGNQSSAPVQIIASHAQVPMGLYNAPGPMPGATYAPYYPQVVYLSSYPMMQPVQWAPGTDQKGLPAINAVPGSVPQATGGVVLRQSLPQQQIIPVVVQPPPNQTVANDPALPPPAPSPASLPTPSPQLQVPPEAPALAASAAAVASDPPLVTDQKPQNASATAGKIVQQQPLQQQPPQQQQQQQQQQVASASSLLLGSLLPRPQSIARQLGVTQYYEAHGCIDPSVYLPPSAQVISCAQPQSHYVCQVASQLHRSARGQLQTPLAMLMAAQPSTRKLLETCLTNAGFSRVLSGMMEAERMGVDPLVVSTMLGVMDQDTMVRNLALVNMMRGPGVLASLSSAPKTPAPPATAAPPALAGAGGAAGGSGGGSGAGAGGGGTAGTAGGGQPKSPDVVSGAAGATEQTGMCSLLLPMLMMRSDVGLLATDVETLFDLRRALIPFECQDLRAGVVPFTMCCPGHVHSPSVMDIFTSLFS